MAQECSFDIVSKVSMHEVHNGVLQAQKEVATRFDFRGSCASIIWEESPPTLKVTADHTMQLDSVIDVTETKLAKRSVPLKALLWKEPERLPGGTMKREATVQQGIPTEKSREIVKSIQSLKLKKVQARIDGDAVRVSGRQRDDLQAVMQHLQRQSFGLPLQFENLR